MIPPLRSRLDANTIGMAQTLRSWLRAGLIDELDPIFLSAEDNRGNEGNGDNTNAAKPPRGSRLGVASLSSISTSIASIPPPSIPRRPEVDQLHEDKLTKTSIHSI